MSGAELATHEAAAALNPATRRKLFRLVEKQPEPVERRHALQRPLVGESDIALAFPGNVVQLFPQAFTQDWAARSCQPDATLLGISRLLSGPHGSEPASVAWAAMLMDRFTYGCSHDPDHYVATFLGEPA